MKSVYSSLVKYPPRRSTDKRIERLEHICKQLRQYNPAKQYKRNRVKRLLWDYESLLDTIQISLG